MGKTTLIEAIIRELGLKPGGFSTREIREAGKRVGFEINAFNGRKGVLARAGLPSLHRVGRYGVNIRDMEEVGAGSLEDALSGSPLIVIDEIGNMEIISRRFQEAVIDCLGSSIPVLGAIKAGRGPFVDGIKFRPDVEVIELRREEFGAVKQRVKKRLSVLLEGIETGQEGPYRPFL